MPLLAVEDAPLEEVGRPDMDEGAGVAEPEADESGSDGSISMGSSSSEVGSAASTISAKDTDDELMAILAGDDEEGAAAAAGVDGSAHSETDEDIFEGELGGRAR